MGKGSVHVPGHLQGQEHAQGGESLERCQATLGQLSEGSGWQKTEFFLLRRQTFQHSV